MTKLSDVKEGDSLVADEGFDCMRRGEVKVVYSDKDGLYVTCNVGMHYLVGQVDDDGNVIGLERAER